MLFTIFQTLKTIVFCHLHEVQTTKDVVFAIA